jgi:hypothetical protein
VLSTGTACQAQESVWPKCDQLPMACPHGHLHTAVPLSVCVNSGPAQGHLWVRVQF